MECINCIHFIVCEEYGFGVGKCDCDLFEGTDENALSENSWVYELCYSVVENNIRVFIEKRNIRSEQEIEKVKKGMGKKYFLTIAEAQKALREAVEHATGALEI